MSYSISNKARIGKGCSFGEGVIIEDGVEIGDNVHIGENTIIYEGTIIKSQSLIQANCLLGLVATGGSRKKLLIGHRATIRSGTIIYSNVTIGKEFNSGHNVLIREDCLVGDKILIGTNSVLDGQVKIGNDTKIQTGVYLTRAVMVEEEVFIGPYAKTTNDKYMFYGAELKPNIIKKGCRLGAGTILLPGVVLEKGVVTGAGTVVVRSVPEGLVVMGNPSKIIKRVKDLGKERAGNDYYC